MVNNSGLKVLLLNTRSIKQVKNRVSQLTLLNSTVSIELPDIVTLVETWLDSSVADHEILNSNFNIFRRDRGSRGGGLILAVNNTLNCTRRLDLECPASQFNEILICELKIEGRGKTAIVVCYRPPSADATFNVNLESVLLNIKANGFKDILLLGDLNLPGVNWESCYSENVLYQHICDILDNHNLIKYNKNPSRPYNENILDVIMSNNPSYVNNIVATRPLIDTDHYMLTFKLFDHFKPDLQPPRLLYQFKACNFDELCYKISLLNLENLVLAHLNDVNIAWLLWRDAVKNVIDQVIPKIKLKKRNTNPWIDGDVIYLANKKETARKLAKQSGNPVHWEKYKSLSNDVKKLVSLKYNQYVNHTFENIDSNPKRFWGLVSEKSKKKSIPAEMYYNNVYVSKPKDKAEAFSNFFYSSFNPNSYEPPGIRVFNNDNLRHLTLTVDEVYKVLNKLDHNKAYGPDGLPTIVYKRCASVLAPSLTILFNLSLDQGILPRQWKQADIVPVFKKGDSCNVTNYRPISLLCIASKVLERCIHHHVFNITKGLISEYQHGFCNQKSTNTQLLLFYDKIHNYMDKGIQTDVAFLDLSKAFDSVPHSLLLSKVLSFGFCGKLYSWLTNYLENRTQKVLVEGYHSRSQHVLSGVPQGSILGPLLFNFYINDMVSCNQEFCDTYLYADDSKLCKPIFSLDDCAQLQSCLDNIQTWSTVWGMNFNVNKCKIMSFTRARNPFSNQYTMNGKPIEYVTEFIDLGVTVCNNLKWDKHITSMTKKANKRLGCIKRTLGVNVNTAVKRCAYTSMVRPLIEFSSLIWSNCDKKCINVLESVQRRASKYILNEYTDDYKSRLLTCDILPLTYRREIMDCVFFYNCLHNLVDINVMRIVLTHTSNLRTRSDVSDNVTLMCHPCNTESYLSFYTNRIVKLWNQLPSNIRELELSDSLSNIVFKKELKSWYYNRFIETFNPDNTCTWTSVCRCARCRVA
jgi:hypothetical protein